MSYSLSYSLHPRPMAGIGRIPRPGPPRPGPTRGKKQSGDQQKARQQDAERKAKPPTGKTPQADGSPEEEAAKDTSRPRRSKE
jgi:hypothetical protein